MEEKIKAFLGTVKGRRTAAAAAVLLVAAAGLGAWTVTASQAPEPAKETAQARGGGKKSKASAKEKTAETASVAIKVTADGMTADTSAVITHWTGTSGDAEGTEFYHATAAEAAPRGTDAVEVAAGSWSVEVLPSVNADGSINEGTSEAAAVDADAGTDGGGAVDLAVATTPAGQVTQDRLNEVLDAVNAAVAKGDATLTGDAGAAVVEKAAGNAAKNPNADSAKVEEKKEEGASAAQETKAQETAQTKKDTGSGSVSTSGSASSESDGSGKQQASQGGSSSAASAKAECSHSWVAVTHQEPVYTEQPVYETRTRTVTDQAAWTETVSTGRSYALFSDGHVEWTGTAADDYSDDHGGYRWIEETTTVTHPAVTHEESYQVQTGTKQVQTGTKTVTDGYRCSKCNATK